MKKILNRETVLYLAFGVATTIVNYAVFVFFYNMVFDNKKTLWANGIAFAAAVVFAYIVNKMFVFESKDWNMQTLRKEIPSFLSARIGSFVIEQAGLAFSENILNLGAICIATFGKVNLDGIMVAKGFLSFIVVVLNYIFCKWFVFKH